MNSREREGLAATVLSPVGKRESACGATWLRVDLHLHTPGVHTFVLPSGSDPHTASGRAELVSRYVDQLAGQGIAIGAITDYNGIRSEWFEPIRDHAAERGIRVLPGAEVSFKTPKYGLHILAIFPDKATAKEVNSFLQALDGDSSKPLLLPDGRHRDIELENTNEPGALKRLRDRFGGLLIVPHADGSNGLCQSFRTGDAAAFLVEVQPDAIEHCPGPELRKLQDQIQDGASFFENLAKVEFSDPKRIEEIGTKTTQDGKPRATYLKLSATDLDALRLALHDPCTRLSIGSPVPPTHPRIRRMDVSGSGFLGNLVIAWNDDLNVIIGGRGAGKSAILETLRYALGLEAFSEASYRMELVQHALGSGGKASVIWERPIGNGKTRAYRVERVWGEEPRVFELDPERQMAVRPSDLFGPTGGPAIFGQREIYAVSGSEEYRIRLLDDLIGEEAKRHAAAVREGLDSLRSNARSIVETQKRLGKREEYRQRLKTIELEIDLYEAHGIATKLKTATSLRADGQHLKGAIEGADRSRKLWKESEEAVLAPIAGAVRNLRKGQSVNKVLLEEAAIVLTGLDQALRDLYGKGQELLNEAAMALDRIDKRWLDAIQPLDEELNRIKREVQIEALDPDRLLQLTEERASIAPMIDELDRAEVELKSLREQRADLVATARDRRYKEHELRRERADAIEGLLRGRLHLGVEFKGQKEEYKRQLVAMLKGSGVSTDAVERLVAPDATDGLTLAEVIRAGSAEIQERFGLTSAMAERLVKWFTDDESRLFNLETVIPRDALRVDLMIEGAPRALDRLSPGQRATAILLLLFALEGRVLVLDQPEDDLDNRFVYEDIVQILRSQKGLTEPRQRRQIIAATHNPNIPVIGDAELVLALEAREGHARTIGRASIDEGQIRELIKTIMEGGEEAFQRRAEKYGGL